LRDRKRDFARRFCVKRSVATGAAVSCRFSGCNRRQRHRLGGLQVAHPDFVELDKAQIDTRLEILTVTLRPTAWLRPLAQPCSTRASAIRERRRPTLLCTLFFCVQCTI
jgi:hypothetical protein